MKRTAVLLALVLLLTCALPSALAAPTPQNTSIALELDGKPIDCDVPAIKLDGRTLAPIRAITEALGGKVDWDNDTKTATITHEGTVLTMTLDDPQVTVNGVTVTLDTQPILYRSRTMVPVRFLAEALGTTVTWDGKRNTVKLTSKAATKGLATLIPQSKAYAEQMARSEFGAVYKKCSSVMKSKITEAYLEQSWAQVVAEIGVYQDIYAQKAVVSGDTTLVYITLNYAYNGLTVQFTYNAAGEIDGLFISYTPIPEPLVDNEIFEEIPVTVGPHALPGILTLPRDVKNPPVALLVQGSGQSDCNETVGASANKPFRDIAHGLAEKGIASLRYDKRFYAHPELYSSASTIQDEVLNDASAAIAFLRADERTRGGKVFVIGHSLGGMLAPKIALDNSSVAGIVSLAGTPRKLEDVILDQNRAAVAAMPELSTEDKAALLASANALVQQVKALKSDSPDQVILGMSTAYWRSLNAIDTPTIVHRLSIPMLILQGSADFQVTTAVDYKAWQTALSGKTNVTYRLYDGLNHMFMPTTGRRDISEYDAHNAVSPGVISDIADWMHKNS